MITNEQNELLLEQQRLLVSLGIIASNLALLAIIVARAVGLAWFYTEWTLAASAFCGFIYVLLSASHLKYYKPGRIYDYKAHESLRRLSYDLMIDVFGINLVMIIASFLAIYLGWIGYLVTLLGFLLLVFLPILLKRKEQR